MMVQEFFWKTHNTTIDDVAWSGRPNETINEVVYRVHTLLEEDHKYLIADLQVQMATLYTPNTSHSTIHTVLCEHLQMLKMCARYVPQQPTEMNQKLQPMGWLLGMLKIDNFCNQL